MSMIQRAAIVALAFATSLAMAQVQYAKGKATQTYSSWKLNDETRSATLRAAQLKAIESYFAEAGEAESANFESVRAKVTADPESFLTDTTVLNEEDKNATKQYSVAVRVSLNVAKLRNTMRASSAVGQAGKGEKSRLTFLFVSRQIDEKKAFDPRVYQREDVTHKVDASSSTSRHGSEGEKVGRGQVNTSAAKSSGKTERLTVSTEVETGGSTTRKASKATYALIPSESMLTVFKQQFGQAGFKVVEAAYVEPSSGGKLSVAAVEEDYKSGRDLKTATKRDMVAGVHNARIPYLAYGSLDASLPETDPQTGLLRVAVTINAKIVDASSDIPEDVANVGPVVVYGSAPEEEEARTLALQNAAARAARDLVAQLNSNAVK